MELQQLPELNDRQKEAMEILRNAPYGTTTILGYGGAIGGGKTHFMSRAAMSIAMSFPGGRILVARNEFNKLKTTTMEEFDKVVPDQMIVRRHDTDNWREIRLSHWPEGVVTRIYFRGLLDHQSFGSEQYSAIFIDEAGEVAPGAAQFLLGTRLRHKLPEIVQEAFLKRDPEWKMRYYFVAASNPYPGWFTDWFYFRQLDEALEASPGSKVHFVQSKMSDNLHNLPENYEAVARATLPPDRVQRFIEGRFDTYSDQVYGEVFNPDVHRWLGEVPEDEIDRVIGGLDFGGARPDAHFSAGLVGVVTKSNRLIRVAEFKSRGPGVQDRQMAWMLAMQTRWAPKGRRIHWVADKTQHFGVHMLRLHGFWVTLSSGKEDEMGINEVARRMMLDDSGLPGSYYLPELQEWEREIYQYRWDQSANDNAPAKRKPIKRNDDLCLAPETLVLTPSGQVPIADLREGDQVVALDGSIAHVVRHVLTKRRAPVVRSIVGATQVVSTPDHRFLGEGGFVAPQEYGDNSCLWVVDANRYTYEYDRTQVRMEWPYISTLPRLPRASAPSVLAEAYPRWGRVSACGEVGAGTWPIAAGVACSPQRSQPAEQRHRKPCGHVSSGTPFAPSETPLSRAHRTEGAACCQDAGVGKAMAYVGGGAQVARGARSPHVGQGRSSAWGLPALWPRLPGEGGGGCVEEEILLEQLQVCRPEGLWGGFGGAQVLSLWGYRNGQQAPGGEDGAVPTLQPVRATEDAGFQDVYDITIDHPSHTFWANGVATHNCDADRYMHELLEPIAIDPMKLKNQLPVVA